MTGRRYMSEHPAWCGSLTHGRGSAHIRAVGHTDADRAALDVALEQFPDQAAAVRLAVYEPGRTVATLRLAPAQARTLRDALSAAIEALEADA